MRLVNKLSNKQFLHYSLVVILFAILGLLLSLVFYFIFSYDVFYLYDSNITIKLNSEYKVNAILSNHLSNSDLTWISTNPDVASIDNNGVINSHNLGNTDIIVKSKFKLFKRKIKVKVLDFKITSVEIDENNIELHPGDTYHINTIINNDIDIRTNLYYSSSDEDIATVSDDGTVRALSEGFCSIKVIDSKTNISTNLNINIVKENREITVINPTLNSEDKEFENIIDAEKLILNSNKINMYTNDTKKVSAMVLPIDATNKEINYTSSDSSIVTVNSNGVIKAKKAGICNIFVSIPGRNISESIVIIVEDKVSLKNIQYSKDEIDIDIGERYLLIPEYFPTNASIKDIYYISSNNSIASIDSNGKIVGKSKGKTTILSITKDGFISNTIKVNVSSDKVSKSNIEDVKIENFKPIMISGKNNKIEISNKNDSKLNLTMSSPDIASVTQEGLITAKKPGVVYLDIESIDGSYHYQKMITILPGEVYAELITLTKYAFQLKVDRSYKLEANVMPENSINKKVIWESSNEDIATVDGNGKVTAHSIGTATITARVSNSGVSRTSLVKVVANEKMIDIRKTELIARYKDFKIFDKGGSTSRALQNFAIGNYNTSNEFIYVSYPYLSNTSKLTNAKKVSLMQTNIVKIPKNDINNYKNRKVMYIKNAGHGQSMDIDINPNYIWLNDAGYVTKDNSGIYWGSNYGITEVKFANNNVNSKIKKYYSFKVYKPDGSLYLNPEVSYDKENDLVSIRSTTNVLIYKASDLKKNKRTLLYSFYVPARSMDGTGYSIQGHIISNGYYYQVRGYVGTKIYVEVYNYAGEYQYSYSVNPKLDQQEAEGIKIYDNTIYVGITSKCKGCAGRVNSIYYFK